MLVSVPRKVTGLLESNSAANEWCADKGLMARRKAAVNHKGHADSTCFTVKLPPSDFLLPFRREIERLMPGGVSARTEPGDDNLDQIRLSILGRLNPTRQRGFDIAGRGHLLAADALTLGELDEIDFGIAEVHRVVVAGPEHPFVVPLVHVADGLVIVVVPHNRENRHAVPRHGPEPGRAIHDGA